MKNQYKGGNCLKDGGGLGQFADLRGGAWQERGVVFLTGGEGDTPVHTMIKMILIWSLSFPTPTQGLNNGCFIIECMGK